MLIYLHSYTPQYRVEDKIRVDVFYEPIENTIYLINENIGYYMKLYSTLEIYLFAQTRPVAVPSIRSNNIRILNTTGNGEKECHIHINGIHLKLLKDLC